jgi:regulatory protein
MPEQSTYRKCYHAALRLLGRRDHSIEELRLKLLHRQFDSDDIGTIVRELCRLNYLNDERCAATFAGHLHQRGFGPAYMRQVLISKGLSPELIERAIADYCVEKTQLEACRSVLDKKMQNSAFVKKNLYRFLFNRGFCARVVHCVLTEAEGRQWIRHMWLFKKQAHFINFLKMTWFVAEPLPAGYIDCHPNRHYPAPSDRHPESISFDPSLHCTAGMQPDEF